MSPAGKKKDPLQFCLEINFCQKQATQSIFAGAVLGRLTTALDVCNSLKDSVISLLRDNTLE